MRHMLAAKLFTIASHTGFDRSRFPVTHAECSEYAWLYNHMVIIVSCTRLLDLDFSVTHDTRQAQMAESS